ncbi:rRNA maturation RNase YbeY [bacterium]|nr:rRNA maturation RNase YbeY [bacterium]
MKRRMSQAELRVHCLIPRARIYRRYLLECAKRALVHFKKPVASIDFIVMPSRKMAVLHRQYLNLPGATDVMAFDLAEPSAPVEGEVYICLERARSQAADYGVSLASEIARLAVHGVLHLAGEDDETEAGRQRMEKLETRALRKGERK